MPSSTERALKDDLHHYLRQGREALLWKLEGVSERDARRPLVPTGTNLLGLVKHSAGVEADYLGSVFGRPFPEPLPWASDAAEDNADMWATAAESRADLVALYRRVWSHSDATVDALPLDAVGHVPWWDEESREPSLHRVLTHVVAEVNRHAGHADLVRELIDGQVGLRPSAPSLPRHDEAWWEDYRDRLEDASRQSG
jgi:uncharacterized damage-inducible protein DinB